MNKEERQKKSVSLQLEISYIKVTKLLLDIDDCILNFTDLRKRMRLCNNFFEWDERVKVALLDVPRTVEFFNQWSSIESYNPKVALTKYPRLLDDIEINRNEVYSDLENLRKIIASKMIVLNYARKYIKEIEKNEIAKDVVSKIKLDHKWWKNGSIPTYDKLSRKIRLENRECEIPPKAYNQQIICEALFPPRRSFGESLPEYEVIQLFYKRKGKDVSSRAFYDAVGKINSKIKADFKITNMLKYQDSPRQVRIRKELFK